MSQSYIRKPNIESRERSAKISINFQLIPESPLKHIGDFFENFFTVTLSYTGEPYTESRKHSTKFS